MKSFKEISASLGDLPTLPVVVSKVLQVVEDSGSSANDLVTIIQNDQAIASKVIRVANSPYYGLRRQVKSVAHAVVLLGFDTVRNLCLGVGVLRSFAPHASTGPLDLVTFWEHTIAVGVGARMLWQDRKWEGGEEMFLAGLIHDVGRLAFLSLDGRDYAAMIRRAERTGQAMLDIEREAYGGTHAELGGILCDHWGFGRGLIAPVRSHHDVGSCSDEFIRRAAGVALCDAVARAGGIGWSVDNAIPSLTDEVLGPLEMKDDDVERFTVRLDGQRRQIEGITEALT